MYDRLLSLLEPDVEGAVIHDKDNKKTALLLDIIIKIKTIKYMDLQTEILEASRRVSLN